MSVMSILNSVILSFLFAEFIRAIFFTREWIYRFKQDHKPLLPWKKGLIIMLLFIVIFPITNWFFIEYISILLEKLGAYQISLFFLIAPATYLWIEKRILSLPWNKKDLIPGAIILLNIIITYSI